MVSNQTTIPSDAEYVAKRLFEEAPDVGSSFPWDRLSKDQKIWWLQIATVAIAAVKEIDSAR